MGNKSISQDARILHQRLMVYISDTFSQLHGDLHLGSYNDYFYLIKTKSGYSAKGLKSLLPWLHEWAETELEPRIYHESKFEDGTVGFRQLAFKYTKARSRFLSSIPELYCLVKKKRQILDLVKECLPFTEFSHEIDYSRCDSLFDLVDIDNAFVTTNWVNRIIKNAEFYSNKQFFEKLSTSLTTPGFRQNIQEVEYALAVFVLWYLGGKRVTRTVLRDTLVDLGYSYYQTDDEFDAFRAYVRRLGLKKYTKVRHK